MHDRDTGCRPAPRRVVTGHDRDGRSIIVTDSPAPNTWRSDEVDGLGASVAWSTDPGPVDNDGAADPARAGVEVPMSPPAGGTIFRIADFPPDAHYTARAVDGMFSTIGGEHARDAAEGATSRHFWSHRTDSLDYAVVLDGEIWMLVDHGEVLLRTGDSIVQRGTSHSWSNRTDRTCRIAFVLLGAPAVVPAEPA